jgi:hypothetical protein
MKDGKIAIVDEQAELVRSIFRRYLELGGVNELVRDLKERNIKTKIQHLSSGKTRGGVPFGRGALSSGCVILIRPGPRNSRISASVRTEEPAKSTAP